MRGVTDETRRRIDGIKALIEEKSSLDMDRVSFCLSKTGHIVVCVKICDGVEVYQSFPFRGNYRQDLNSVSELKRNIVKKASAIVAELVMPGLTTKPVKWFQLTKNRQESNA